MLGFYSIWPLFLCLTLLVGSVGTPLFRRVSPPTPAKRRFETLDGLRGFLAMSVLFHHAAMVHVLSVTGAWSPLPSRFYSNLGQLGVSMFFMITGFLFWGQLLDSNGKPNWLKLYIGRLFRIVPLAWLMAAIVLAIVAAMSGFQLREPLSRVLSESVRWFAAGSMALPDINGVKNSWRLIFDVTWTLHLEWMFYLSLPVLALFARFKRIATALPAIIFLTIIIHVAHASFPGKAPREIILAMFAAGMTAAGFVRNAPALRLTDPWRSLLVLVLVGSSISLFPSENSSVPLILVATAFYLIASGTSVFGVLTMRGARRMGDISFGIYLLHALALNTIFISPWLLKLVTSSPTGYWVIVFIAASSTVVASTGAHFLVEKPFITLGRHLASVRLRMDSVVLADQSEVRAGQ